MIKGLLEDKILNLLTNDFEYQKERMKLAKQVLIRRFHLIKARNSTGQRFLF